MCAQWRGVQAMDGVAAIQSALGDDYLRRPARGITSRAVWALARRGIAHDNWRGWAGAECPQLIDDEVNGHGDDDRNRRGRIELGAEPGGVIEDLRGKRNR